MSYKILHNEEKTIKDVFSATIYAYDIEFEFPNFQYTVTIKSPVAPKDFKIGLFEHIKVEPIRHSTSKTLFTPTEKILRFINGSWKDSGKQIKTYVKLRLQSYYLTGFYYLNSYQNEFLHLIKIDPVDIDIDEIRESIIQIEKALPNLENEDEHVLLLSACKQLRRKYHL